MIAVEVFAVAFGTLFSLGGLGLCLHAYVQHKRVSASTQWPTAEGRVLSSGVTTGGPPVLYYARVSYEYFVGDKRYKGNRLEWIPQSHSSREGAALEAEEYPAGSPVTVRYSPDNPKLSVIRTGWPNTGSRYFTWGLGLFLVVAGLAYMLVFTVP